jgi:hypothetical protein
MLVAGRVPSGIVGAGLLGFVSSAVGCYLGMLLVCSLVLLLYFLDFVML